MHFSTSPSTIACKRLLEKPEVRLILSLLAEGGLEGRLVGGCVRDALLGQAGADIDIAVNAPPTVTQALFEHAGFKVIPTGLQHGTVTILVDHEPFELTSLRRDVITDGRHATVAYTTDWHEDAARRDFTFNALYLTADGHIDDFFGGQADLAHGLVRFIGDPNQRIQEDFLRILRYYRFVQRFSTVEKDGSKHLIQPKDRSLTPCDPFPLKEELKSRVEEAPPASPTLKVKEEVSIPCCECSLSKKRLETEKSQETRPSPLEANPVFEKEVIGRGSKRLLRDNRDLRSSRDDYVRHQSPQASYIPERELKPGTKSEGLLRDALLQNANDTNRTKIQTLLPKSLEEQLDCASHKAVRHHVDSLWTLSKERIQTELFKILAHPFPQVILALMEADGVFQALFNRPAEPENLDRLVRLQETASPALDMEIKTLERLFLLFPYGDTFYTKHFRLSRIQLKQLEGIFRIQNLPLTAKELFAIRYRLGDIIARMKIDLFLARSNELLDELNVQSSLLYGALATPQPPFPLQGADLLQLGLRPGKALGELLRKAENFWFESEGQANKEACLRFVQESLL